MSSIWLRSAKSRFSRFPAADCTEYSGPVPGHPVPVRSAQVPQPHDLARPARSSRPIHGGLRINPRSGRAGVGSPRPLLLDGYRPRHGISHRIAKEPAHPSRVTLPRDRAVLAQSTHDFACRGRSSLNAQSRKEGTYMLYKKTSVSHSIWLIYGPSDSLIYGVPWLSHINQTACKAGFLQSRGHTGFFSGSMPPNDLRKHMSPFGRYVPIWSSAR